MQPVTKFGACPASSKAFTLSNYPRELVEIVVVDGLSEDGTQAYARGAGCVVVDNPRLLAEPGHLLGYRAATGDLLCIIAADNILHTPDFIERIVAPFADPNVYAAVPRVVWTHDDNWSTRYINDFTDPFNHFLYGSAANQTTFGRAYRVKRRCRLVRRLRFSGR